MDKRSLLAVILIGFILTGYMIYLSVTTKEPVPEVQKAKKQTEALQKDSSVQSEKIREEAAKPKVPDSVMTLEKYGQSFSKFANGSEDIITVENDLIIAKISSKGATLLSWTLKNYKSWNGYPADLIWNKGGELFMSFNSRDNVKVDTRDLYFTYEKPYRNYYRLSGKDSLTFVAKLEPEPGKTIERKYTFYGNTYHVTTDVVLKNMETIIPIRGYHFEWTDGLRYQEHNSVDESSEALSMVSMNGEIEECDASGNDPVAKTVTGKLDFACVKSKYFTAGIIPLPEHSYDGSVLMNGTRQHVEEEGVIERYNISLIEQYRGGEQTRSFKIYIGPLDYKIVRDYGMEAAVNFGWRLVVRPIGEYFMLPIFTLIHSFVANFGIAIIIFSLLMKLLLYPLSISQMRSAQRMQLIAPEIAAMREKYKDDQKQQQAEMMKMYSQYGVNPAGGCLPLILQMPILYALWAVLRSSIDLRQAGFGLWIHDLSIPDYLINLPISIIGIKHLSGLALAMGVTMFFQQKMTITDPKQKAMVYMMPIMFTLMFSNFPSGLNLYYFMFNLMSIGQQVYINKFSRKKVSLAELKKMPKKEGWFAKKMREAQEIAASQGKTIPGAAGANGGTKQLNFRKRKPSQKKKK